VTGRAAPAWRAVAVVGVGVGLLGTWAVPALRVPTHETGSGWYVAVAMVPSLLVSGLLVARLPGAAVTRLLTTLVLCQLALLASDVVDPWFAGGGAGHLDWLVGLGDLVWLGTVPLLALVLVVFPDGVPRSGLWRRTWTVQVVVIGLLAGIVSLRAVGVDGPWLLVPAVAGGAVLVLTGVLRSASLIGMWWRSRGTRRRELWPFVVVAGSLAAVYTVSGSQLLLTGHGMPSGGVVGGLVFAGIIGGLPVAVGFSVLRDRLFGIEVTVNRVAVAATVAVLLFGVYAAAVATAAALTGRHSDLGQLLAAGATVAALSPLYRLARTGVDRVMFGDRDRPDRALGHLAQLLGQAVDPLEVPDVLVDAVAGALRLPFVALERDTGSGTVRSAARGATPAPGRVIDFPICYAGERLGVLLVGLRAGEARMNAADRRLLGDLAAQAAPALYSGRLVNELADSRERLRQGRLEERARLRRALHDGLSPSLSGIAIAAAAARGRRPDDPTVARLLDRIECEAGSGAATLRALLAGLRPPGLDELGLTVAIETRAGELAEVTGVAFDVDADTPLPALAPDAEQTAYLIAVEAMVNVVRHAQATHCAVTLTDHGDAVGVRVSDDGHGLVPDACEGEGLSSARQRVAACGGSLTVETGRDGGTRLDARLPAWSATA
jgi:signal transduction histidine kinase